MSGPEDSKGAAAEVAPVVEQTERKKRSHQVCVAFQERVKSARTRGRKAANEVIDGMFVEGTKDARPAQFTQGWAASITEAVKFTFMMSFADTAATTIGLAALFDRINAVEDKVKEFKYCGVWQRAAEYKHGNFVTFEGAVWHCNKATTTKPGTSEDWTLAVKSGR